MGTLELDVVPSPKFQFQAVMLPSVEMELSTNTVGVPRHELAAENAV